MSLSALVVVAPGIAAPDNARATASLAAGGGRRAASTRGCGSLDVFAELFVV